MRRGAALVALIIAAALSPAAWADWTASGTFEYTDRTYSLSGFTGTAALSVREADVQVFDVNTLTVLGSGATDTNGDFSFSVTDASTRDVGVRVLASTNQTAGLNFRVVDDQNSNATYTYNDPAMNVLGHGSTTNVNFGTMTMPSAIGPVGSTDWSSQVFNTFDACRNAARWVESVDGTPPAVLLTVQWNPTNGRGGSSAGGNTLFLADDDAYDDPNILHEVGHYIENLYGQNQSTGGTHFLGDDDEDPRLSWSEGVATFFNNAILQHHGLARPDVYSDRDSFGAAGTGFSYSVEPTENGGDTNEVAVNSCLYDLIDDATTDDGSPGVDDDTLSGLQSSVWMVLEEMDTRNLPATSLEDFWDIWFDLGLGNQAGMETTFAAHSVDYVADAQEPNDRPEDATLLTVGGGFQENTFYDTDANHGGDEDWFRFTAVANTHHRIEISGAVNTIFGRPNPEMFLLDVTGEQVLARSDDPYDTSLNIQSSSTAQDMDETVPSILWRAPSSGDFYVYVRHESGALNKGQRYGTYQIQVTNAGSPTPTIDQVLAQTMLPGQSYHVTIQGSNFATGTTVTTSDAGITASEVNWRSPEMLDVVLDVGGGVANGTDTLTVSNPGAGSAVSGAVLTTSSSAQPPVAISEVGLGIDAVELINLGTVAANLTGWEIRGRTTGASLDYTLPSFSLPAGATVVVHEGSGTDTATELYASVNFPWVNGGTGDVSLLDASDNAVDYIRFSSGYVTTHLTPQGTGGLWMQPEFQSPPFGTVSRSFDRVRPRTRDGIDGALSTIPNGGGAGRINALDAHEPNGGPRLVEVLMRSDSVLDLEISPAPAGTDEDWFGILVRAGDEVRISALFGDAAGDLDMELYAPGEESTPFASATSSTDDEEIIVSPATTTSLGGGIYRLRVFGFSGATNSYSLMTQPVPAELTVFTAEP